MGSNPVKPVKVQCVCLFHPRPVPVAPAVVARSGLPPAEVLARAVQEAHAARLLPTDAAALEWLANTARASPQLGSLCAHCNTRCWPFLNP